MAKKDQKNSSGPKLEAAQPNLPLGVRLVRTLRGHTDWIGRIAWSPDGRILASPSQDKTIRLWDLETGESLRALGSEVGVNSVAFDSTGRTLVSGSNDHTVKLWDVANGQLLRILEGHRGAVRSVVIDRSDITLASGSDDGTIKLWDLRGGRLLHTLRGHKQAVWGAVFDAQSRTMISGSWDHTLKLWEVQTGRLLATIEGRHQDIYSAVLFPDGRTLASGSGDATVNLWDVEGERLLHTLEGHTYRVICVDVMFDGKLIASKGSDHTIRLWSSNKGSCLGLISEPTGSSALSSVAFHPRLPLLASVGSAQGSPIQDRDNLIHIWELDVATLLGHEVPPTVTYTSAKIVLVGESNVGKSYLAHRIATGTRPEEGTIKSTHGMKFWPLEPERLSPAAKAPENQRRDVVLWDMGGQEEYRLVHQLFLHDTTVALVLLDPTRGPTAFKEAETWNKYLDKQLRGRAAVKLLVGAKLDRPSDTIDRPGLERLVKDCNFAGFYETSAISGRGMTEFCEAVAGKIDWDGLGKTSRPELFQRIRDEIEDRRSAGDVVLPLTLLQHKLAMSDTTLRQAVEYVVDRLVRKGDLTRASTKTGDPLLKLKRLPTEYEQVMAPGIVFDLAVETFHQISIRATPIALSREEVKFTFVDLCQSVISRHVDAVTEQLASQGVIARSRVASGESVLVLQVQEIERYAGSLIVAARNNPRGVPALELRAIAKEDFPLPGISPKDRLTRDQEKPVIDCTLQLMLEHGICFEHEGLLIFPTLFAPAPESEESTLPHAVSLYYDFAGAIDNIYASLVAWLVLARDFGRVRLWSDRAEFEIENGGLCGLRKVGRPGGFAHVDVYFETATPTRRQELFVSFVEEHLRQNGVEIREHVAVTCKCGHKFEEETLRKRIARGEKDVGCPVCEARHNLAEGAAESRQRNPEIARQTWALKTHIEKRRQKSTEGALEVIDKSIETTPQSGPIRLLHLSDLHFTAATPIPARLQWLLDDLKEDGGLGFKQLDYLVISGDFTDKGNIEGFEKAYEFVSGLASEFGLSAERCIFAPGNHDVVDRLDAYSRRKDSSGLKSGEWFQQGPLIMARDPEKYPRRLKPFSDSFYHKFLQRPYPTDVIEQGMATPFWETGLQFLTLNSCWEIDEFNRKRAGLLPEAVANSIKQAQKQEQAARKTGLLPKGKPLLRLAVWHHAVTGPEQMKDVDFLGNLQKTGVRIVMHGDVHEMKSDLIGYRHEKNIHVAGAGSFGARAEDRPESTPRLYNVLEIARDLKSARVYTREQRKPDGAWDGWHEWPDPDGGKGRVPYYDIHW